MVDETPLNRARRNAVRILSTAVILLAAVVGLLVARNLGENARTDQRVRQSQDSTCAFWRDLSTLPLSPNAGDTLLRIVADSRAAYDALGCAALHGQLPAPDPRLSKYPAHQSATPSPAAS